MNKRDLYRSKAAACLHEAETLHGPHEREAMLRLVEAYVNLADRLGDRHDHDAARSSPGQQQLPKGG
jgi:hypothetical protein